jgi:sugar phosphate permease
MITVREPERKDKLTKQGKDVELKLNEALTIIFRRAKTYFGICLGTAFTALVNYGCSAWIPTYFNRTFGWSVPKAGLSFGLILITASVSGILWGGWYADRLMNKGVANGRVRIGVIAAVVSLLSCFIPLLNNPNIVLGLLAVPSFFLAAPMGASTTAVQELMPNQVRALASAIFLFLINIIGLGLGPTIVAVFNDYIFLDENAIRFSMTALFTIGGAFALLFYWISYSTYNETVARLAKEINSK